ncbi:S8 family serine peptidase [Pseudomonas aeruginosa]|uniref:S8 family serine peptidase n=1 Tax=Pseudomonas spirodelae TaxID=3101751 RepID=A0ABU5PBG0_9PSED|nr:S8 family serine peptidase [Pseudomonas sp. T5W1]MCF6751950.1 S8 family serine peptidase [Stutzerimonas stutzeri]MCO3672006.1 peptidase S8 and S53 subtilisin kexin sedolisin [Pseudomonas aeruginosa]MEA1607024.1 S8 family serine peptidase [Pseudomonas sp. T5W1]
MATELRIGIVDSGHGAAQASQVLAARRFWLADERLQEGATQLDSLGHGTAVLAAIAERAPAAQFCVAQVFSERWLTSPLQIAAAIYWLMEEDVALINLSLGVRQDRPLLREACAAAQAAGILLCAASPARGEPVFPASYPGVLRVTGDARCAGAQWSWLHSPQADFGAPVAALNGGLAGASIASAVLSGHAAEYLLEQPAASAQMLLEHLRSQAAFVGPERREVMPDG